MIRHWHLAVSGMAILVTASMVSAQPPRQTDLREVRAVVREISDLIDRREFEAAGERLDEAVVQYPREYVFNSLRLQMAERHREAGRWDEAADQMTRLVNTQLDQLQLREAVENLPRHVRMALAAWQGAEKVDEGIRQLERWKELINERIEGEQTAVAHQLSLDFVAAHAEFLFRLERIDEGREVLNSKLREYRRKFEDTVGDNVSEQQVEMIASGLITLLAASAQFAPDPMSHQQLAAEYAQLLDRLAMRFPSNENLVRNFVDHRVAAIDEMVRRDPRQARDLIAHTMAQIEQLALANAHNPRLQQMLVSRQRYLNTTLRMIR